MRERERVRGEVKSNVNSGILYQNSIVFMFVLSFSLDLLKKYFVPESESK